MEEKLLEENNIPETWRKYCFISEGTIYTPQFDNDGNLKQTGEEYYNYIQANKIDICPSKTIEERLAEAEQENKLLKAQVVALNGVTDFHEELIVELATVVYA